MLLISVCSIVFFLLMIMGYATQKKVSLVEEGFPDSNVYYVNNQTYFFVFLLLVSVSTLRFGFIDTYAYKDVYKLCANYDYVTNSNVHDMEEAWYYLNYALNQISHSPKMIIGLTAILVIGSYVFIIKKYSTDPLFSLILFFCLQYLDTNNGMRQMLAASIVIIAYHLLLQKKLWCYIGFVLLVFIGMQFHESAKITFVIALLVMGKSLNIRTLATFLISLVFVAAPSAFRSTFEQLFAEDSYADYILGAARGMGEMRGIVVAVVPLIFTFIYVKMVKKEQITPTDSLMINMVVINSVFVLMGLTMQFWARLAFYTSFAPMIMMPKYINVLFPQKYRSILKPIIIVLYFIFFAYNIYKNVGYGSMDAFYASWD